MLTLPFRKEWSGAPCQSRGHPLAHITHGPPLTMILGKPGCSMSPSNPKPRLKLLAGKSPRSVQPYWPESRMQQQFWGGKEPRHATWVGDVKENGPSTYGEHNPGTFDLDMIGQQRSVANLSQARLNQESVARPHFHLGLKPVPGIQELA